MRPILERVNLPWHGWHAFRRGLGTTLHELKAQDKTIQSVLRHSDVNTTLKYYVRSTSAAATEAMAELDERYASQLVQ